MVSLNHRRSRRHRLHRRLRHRLRRLPLHRCLRLHRRLHHHLCCRLHRHYRHLQEWHQQHLLHIAQTLLCLGGDLDLYRSE